MADQSTDDPKNLGGASAQAQPLGAPPVIDDGTMDDLLDKLRLLDYDEFLSSNSGTFKPLTKTYFAVQSEKGTHQFYYFTSLCSWLMKKCGNSNFSPPGEFDDPNATATNVLQELGSMGIKGRDLAPNRIRQGHGDAVLTILCLLVDKALLTSNFSFAAPVYPAGAADIEDHDTADGEGLGGDDMVDDHIAIDSEDEDELFTGLGGQQRQDRGEEEIVPQVTAEAWAMEVERIAPLLTYSTNEARDWRSRVENAGTLLKAVDKIYPEVRTMLERMGEDISKTLERIQKREQTLGQQFSEQVDGYRTKLRELNQVQDSFQVSSKSVGALTAELNGISEALEQCKSQIQDREEKSSDTTPLMKVKEAVAKVKAEIKEMSLRIGVLQHTVLHSTLRQQKQRRAVTGQGEQSVDDQQGIDEFGPL